MTIRHDMLAAASRAKHLLRESAADVAAFVQQQMNADGGFRGRGEASDLYYTVFGMEIMLALGAPLETEAVAGYLRQFGDGGTLDLAHLACLARCRANLAEAGARLDAVDGALARRLAAFRCEDGGYANVAGARGTAYGCFLALGAYQDLGCDAPDAAGLPACVDSLRRADGSYANEAGIATGSTPATAAAVTILHYLRGRAAGESLRWLAARSRATGGFLATPTAPIPDLLSTATAIHALALTGARLDDIRQPTLEFVDSLWSAEGAFAGNWLDDALDCEYTYYALLALGHLEGS
jgi:hypothetical protein